jgi:Flp pilus assembly protein TadD
MDQTPGQATQKDIDHYNSLYEWACELTDNEMLLSGIPLGPPGWWARKKLSKALKLFAEVVQMNPESWPSLWAMGKIYQRLGNSEASLQVLKQAHQINPQQSDVAREAGLAALDCGVAADALKFCKVAVDLAPQDAGLVANLAWAHVISGDMKTAQSTIQQAVDASPEDKISQSIQRVIGEIARGERPRPKCLKDISR